MKKIAIGLFILCGFLLLILGLASCSNTNDNVNKETNTIAVEEVVETQELEISNETINMVIQIFEDHMGDFVSIKVDQINQAVLLTPTDSELVSEIVMIANGDVSKTSDWQEMSKTFAALSTSVEKHLPGYSLWLLNPLNEELTLLACYNGIVVYDFTKD